MHRALVVYTLYIFRVSNLITPIHNLFFVDAYALAKAGLAPLETVVEILRALQSEETSIVWGAIAGVLGGLHLLMEQLGESDVVCSFVSTASLHLINRFVEDRRTSC